jgi:hypothetical protein
MIDATLKNPNAPALKTFASNCVGQQLLHTRHAHMRLQLTRTRTRRKKKKEEDPHDIVH